MLPDMQNPGWRAGASRELGCLSHSPADDSGAALPVQSRQALKLHRLTDYGEVSKDATAGKSPEIPAISCKTADHGDSFPYIGVAAKLAKCASRGGARNRADRESRELSVSQVGNLMAAAKHADAIGLPLTRFITIHWASAGVMLEAMVKATGRFIDLLTKALKRHGSDTAWLYVHEGGERQGGHCHLLAHVPARLVATISKLQKGWLRRITGRTYRKKVIKSKPVGGRLRLEINNPALFAANFETVIGYLLKGVREEIANCFGLGRTQPTGCIIGKRCGTSQNIGAKARNAMEPRP